jgi:hypothetical protein
MDWQDLVSNGFGQAHLLLKDAAQGLGQDDLDWRPKPDCNSIGWLCWHLVRQQDVSVSYAMKEEQLWLRDGWHAKFGRPADPQDYGTGQKPGQLAAFESPGADVITGYSKAVKERTKAFLKGLSEKDLDRVMELPGFGAQFTLGALLIATMMDSVQHAGQAGYVRGLRQGLGWHKEG